MIERTNSEIVVSNIKVALLEPSASPDTRFFFMYFIQRLDQSLGEEPTHNSKIVIYVREFFGSFVRSIWSRHARTTKQF